MKPKIKPIFFFLVPLILFTTCDRPDYLSDKYQDDLTLAAVKGHPSPGTL